MGKVEAPTFTLAHDAENGVWSTIVKGYGRSTASGTTYSQALSLGRVGMIARMKDVYDGERDKPAMMRLFRSLPTEALAVVVADCTYNQ